MAGYKKAGTDLDALLEPWQSGDGNAAATGYKINGADLNTKYAPAAAGSAYTGGTGYLQNGSDIGPRFAAKGSRATALGFDGVSYVANGGRGSQTVSLTMNTNGTWSISARTSGTPLTGTWLNSGGTASDYTVQFVMTAFSNGPDEGGGSDSFVNGAPTAVALTTARTCSCSAGATVLGSTAGNSGTVVVKVFKNGVLVSTSSCGFSTSAAG